MRIIVWRPTDRRDDWSDGHVMRDVTADCFLSARMYLATTKTCSGAWTWFTRCRNVTPSINLGCKTIHVGCVWRGKGGKDIRFWNVTVPLFDL